MKLSDYIQLPERIREKISDAESPWHLTAVIPELLHSIFHDGLGEEFQEKDGVFFHRTAVIEPGATLKPPIIISSECFIAAGCYLRAGVFLDEYVTLGPGVEVKSSILGKHSSAAHFNFVGDSLLGANVNIEAGAILANHFNERTDKQIFVLSQDRIIRTGVNKFGSLVGDRTKIGANAVLSPGSVLERDSVVPRLTCVIQVPG